MLDCDFRKHTGHLIDKARSRKIDKFLVILKEQILNCLLIAWLQLFKQQKVRVELKRMCRTRRINTDMKINNLYLFYPKKKVVYF